MYSSRALLLALLSLAGKTTAAPPGCDGNSCERAFNGDPHTLAAASFCSQFTTAITLTTNGFPTYATAACTLVAQISSICSCAYPASSQTTSTNTPTVTPTSSSISSSRSSSLSSSRSSSLSNNVSSSSMSSSSSSKSSQLSSSSSKVASSSSSSAIITAPNSSGTAIQTSVTSSTSSQFASCVPDNCLRAFDRGNGGAFCSLFTLGGTNAPALPTYAIQCGPNTSARVSSACTCLNNGNPTASFSSTSPSPTPVSSTIESSTISTPAACPIYLPAGCNRDNCFRAMERQGGVGATAFCATFTTAVVTALSALPTYYTQCTAAPVLQISSACSCLSVASASASASAYVP